MKKLVQKTLKFLLLLIISSGLKLIQGQPQANFTVSGYVYEAGSRETLIGATVYETNHGIGVVSNTYGFFSITLPAGEVELIFSYVGFANKVVKKNLNANQRLDVELELGVELQEVVVSAEHARRISQTTRMSAISIPIIQAQKVPSLLGEKDMLKVLQLMPGVQSGTEGTSGFFVRGGSQDQNLIILDDATVYNAHHLFGFFSVFNGDAIKNMQLYKGDFPARFGGRLSSVLDIQMKDGNKKKLAGETGIGLISSRLTLEGPIVKDKASFLVSGRRTYIDLLLKPFMNLNDQSFGYFFYDLNAKLNYDINDKNRLFLSGYFGRDKFHFTNRYSSGLNRVGLFWQNQTATLRLATVFNERLFGSGSLFFSNYLLELSQEEKWSDFYWDLKYNSGIRDLGFKYDFLYNPNPKHHIRAGVKVVHHNITPRALIQREGSPQSTPVTFNEVENTVESAVYIEDEIRIGPNVKINPGLRFSHFTTDGTSYQALEPRFSANVILGENLSAKASYAAMRQYLHLLSSTGIGLPTDLWVASTKNIKPQNNWQVAGGLAYDWLDKGVEITLEGYYKKLNNIISYSEGASFLDINDPSESTSLRWEDQITAGTGTAYGMELLMHRKSGRLSGWVGYTLSWIRHQFDEINFGRPFWAHHDRRHDFSLVGIYEASPAITLSFSWVFSTGKAYDLEVASAFVNPHSIVNNPHHPHYYSYMHDNVPVYDQKHDFRGGPYHRLDFGIQFHSNKVWFGRDVKRTIEVGAYNAYSRKNPFFYIWQYVESNHSNNYDGYFQLNQVSLFPIIPSISVNYKF